MLSNNALRCLPLLLSAALVTACGEQQVDANTVVPAASPTGTDAARLASARDGNWITLSGRIVGKGADRFILDYGPGRVTVEMDDWDWFKEGRQLLAGDEVTVTGRIDRDFFEQKKIEASSVYVKSLGTVFYANPQDEEDIVGTTVYVPSIPGWTVATGTVSGIEGREFSVGAVGAEVRVDTAKMADNPLDSEGKFQVKAGDRVQVWGRLDIDPKERNEIMAEGVAVLTPDRTKRQAASPTKAKTKGSSNTSDTTSPSKGMPLPGTNTTDHVAHDMNSNQITPPM